jgi:uncharacterized protein (DUF2249 family)
MSVTTLNIQSIIPQNRHPLVFAVFESTLPGASFVLVNNHDPMPLQRQLSQMYPGTFAWNYLEQGPQVWRVEVRKEETEAHHGGGCCGSCG